MNLDLDSKELLRIGRAGDGPINIFSSYYAYIN